MMTQPQQIGKQGEAIAATYLEQKGWRIAARNWRKGRGELDLVAWDPDNTLVFVEVKTRRRDDFGGPENAVDRRKQRQLFHLAAWYMASIQYEWKLRFDVIAVVIKPTGNIIIRHHEDAFFDAG